METTTSFMNLTTVHIVDFEESYSRSVLWVVGNVFITVATILGNTLTLSAILTSKKLSSMVANQFIFSLAVSDFLVGLSIPYHMSFYLTDRFGQQKLTCLLRFVLITFACASSIFNLLLIAMDRYVAIVHPLHYNRYMTRKMSVFTIIVGWIISFITASMPLYWNTWYEGVRCELDQVSPKTYIYYIITPLFGLIWVIMFFLYTKICKEASRHAKRMRQPATFQNFSIRDSKSFQVMMTILGCFSICWLPYIIVTIYTRSTESLRTPFIYELSFDLAVANSGMNPLIYAWKNSNFRKAFYNLVRCKSPNSSPSNHHYITNHIPSIKNSLNGIQNGSIEDFTRSEVDIEMNSTNLKNIRNNECSVRTELTNTNSL